MKKSEIKPVDKFLIFFLLVFFVMGAGCATNSGFVAQNTLKDNSVKFDPAHITGIETKTYSPSKFNPVTSEQKREELLAQGYAQIGVVEGKHFEKKCDANGDCEVYMNQADHLAAMLHTT